MSASSLTNPFDQIAGNDQIKAYLSRLIEKKSIPQSLLFAGPKGSGKSLFAEAFAKLIVKTEKNVHPDVHHYFPEGKIGMHSIQSMRNFSETVYLAPFQANKKVFIIHDAHRMLAYSANALLKTFEEPALDSVIILISEAPERLLPTVMSRCQTIRFLRDSTQTITASEPNQHPERIRLLNLLSQGQLYSYTNIVAFSKDFSECIEEQLKEEEKTLLAKMTEAFSDKPTAQQRQVIEKEIDGTLSVKKAFEAKFLLDVVLSWYRDLHLLAVSADDTYLINSDYKPQLLKSLQRGDILPLEKIEKTVSEAILSLERSTSLNLCLECCFLKILDLRSL